MLPTYSKQYDREDLERDADLSNPLLNPSSPRTSFETAPPVYPPSSSSALPPSTEGRHTVEYTYSPVYPREGDTQYAVGILGRTKGVSDVLWILRYLGLGWTWLHCSHLFTNMVSPA
jgi:hypothetical protein